MSDSIDEVLKELEKEEATITIRSEMRRFSKPVTLVLGLNPKVHDMKSIAKELKSRLSTGGTVKEGYIMLQGDFRDRVKEILVQLGFKESSIEVH
ncbi:MAG: stress response translation initiation inhibitor YciH [Thaumarchaeota archaeon]|nr:stress response translation initiation inhibitor YciH [Nitrososphaerota archaeon]